MSQGSLTHSEERAIRCLLHTKAHRHPQLPNVIVTDCRERVCLQSHPDSMSNFALLDCQNSPNSWSSVIRVILNVTVLSTTRYCLLKLSSSCMPRKCKQHFGTNLGADSGKGDTLLSQVLDHSRYETELGVVSEVLSPFHHEGLELLTNLWVTLIKTTTTNSQSLCWLKMNRRTTLSNQCLIIPCLRRC